MRDKGRRSNAASGEKAIVSPGTRAEGKRMEAGSILFLAEATTGGGRLHLRQLIDACVTRKTPAGLVYSDRGDPDFREDLRRYASLGVPLFPVPMEREVSPVGDLRAIFSVRRLLRKIRPGILHVHSSKAGAVGRFAAAGLGIPVLYTPHCFSFCADFRMKAVYRVVEILLSRLCRRIIWAR